MIWKLPVDKRDALFAAIAQAQKLYVPAAAEKGVAVYSSGMSVYELCVAIDKIINS